MKKEEEKEKKRKEKGRIAFALLTSANSSSEIACLILSE